MLLWAITIHKSQGSTLEMAKNDLGNSEKCAGMTPFPLSCVKKPENILLQYFLYERLKKVTKAKQLQTIRSAIIALDSKFEVTYHYPISFSIFFTFSYIHTPNINMDKTVLWPIFLA